MTSIVIPTEDQLQQAAFEVAHHYLQAVKRWKPEEYWLEVVETDETREPFAVVLDGVYKADLHTDQRGGGQSVQLHVDAQNRRVVRELAYQ